MICKITKTKLYEVETYRLKDCKHTQINVRKYKDHFEVWLQIEPFGIMDMCFSCTYDTGNTIRDLIEKNIWDYIEIYKDEHIYK